MLHAIAIRFWSDQGGATAIEYGLIAALIAITLLVSLALVGTNVESLYANSAGSAASAFAEASARLR
jgi:pilus assembly protein Flp/PilA